MSKANNLTLYEAKNNSRLSYIDLANIMGKDQSYLNRVIQGKIKKPCSRLVAQLFELFDKYPRESDQDYETKIIKLDGYYRIVNIYLNKDNYTEIELKPL